MTNEDKRQTPRKPFYASVKLSIGQHSREARGQNISQGGMSICGDFHIAPGTKLNVTFSVVAGSFGRSQLSLSAKACHSVLSASSGGMVLGLMFLDVSKENLKLLNEFINAA